MAAQNIVVSITAQTQAVDALTASVGRLEQKDRELVESFKQAQRESQNLGRNFGGLENTIRSIGGVVAGAFAVDRLQAFGEKVIQVRSEFQRLEAVLTNTLGSRAAAGLVLQNIQEFASTTNFSVLELTQNFVKLANQGFIPTQAQLRNLADLANSTGKSFDQLTEAIIDAQTFEFERLKEFGIRAKKEGENITFTFKGVETQVKANNEAVRDYILSLGELNGVQGSTEAISKTLGGQISNLGDAYENLLNTLLRSREGPVADAIETLSGFLNLLAEGVKSDEAKAEDRVNRFVNRLLATDLAGKTAREQIEGLTNFLNVSSEKIGEYEASIASLNRQLARLGEDDEGRGPTEDRLDEVKRSLDEEIKLRNALAAQISLIEQGITNAEKAELDRRKKERKEQAKEDEKRREREAEEWRKWWRDIRRRAQEFEEDIADVQEKANEEAEERRREALRRDRELIDENAEETLKRFRAERDERRKLLEAYAQDVQAIQLQTVEGFAGLLGTLSQLAGENRTLALASLALEKGKAIAEIIINLQAEKSKYFLAYAGIPGVGPGIAASLSTAATVRAALGIATITAQGILQAQNAGRGFKKGTSFLQGPGDGQSDSIVAYMPMGQGQAEMIRLSKGERIVSAEDNRRGWHIYEAMKKNPMLIPRMERWLQGMGLPEASGTSAPRFDDSRIVGAIERAGSRPSYQTVIDRRGVSLYVQGRNYRHLRNDRLSRLGGGRA